MTLRTTLLVLGCATLLVGRVLADDVDSNFSLPVLNDSYVSRTEFDGQGLGIVYSAGRQFLRLIQHEDPLPPDVIVVVRGGVAFNTAIDAPGAFVDYYSGVEAVVLVGLLLALLLPLGRLFWCCCSASASKMRSRRRSRRRRQGKELDDYEYREDEDRAPCVTPVLMGVTTCLALTFALLCLVTNAYMMTGIANLRGRFGEAVADVNLFIDNAEKEVDTILVTNFQELTGNMKQVLNTRGTEASNIVAEVIQEFPLDTAKTVALNLRNVLKDVEDMKTEIAKVQGDALHMITVLNSVKSSLESKCVVSACDDFLQKIVIPSDEIFKSLPDLTESEKVLQDFNPPNFDEGLQNVTQALQVAQESFDHELQMMKDSVLQSISDTGATLQDLASTLTSRVGNVTLIVTDADKNLDKVNRQYIVPYNEYRYYFFLLIGIVLLAVPVVAAVGLFVGGCTARSSYGIISIATCFIFIFVFFLTAATAFMFLTGLIADRGCEVLRKPQGNQILDLVDEVIRQNSQHTVPNGVPVKNISAYITECRADEPLYQIMDLESSPLNISQVEKYAEKFDLERFVKELSRIVNDQIKEIKFVPDATTTEIKKLQNSQVSELDFPAIQGNITAARSAVESLDPEGWANALQDLVPGDPFEEEAAQIRSTTADCTALLESADKLSALVSQVEVHIQLGQDTDFRSALGIVLDEADRVTQFVLDTAPRIVSLASDTATELHGAVQSYLWLVTNRVRNDALKCGPMARVLDGLLEATCDEIVNPFHGFWVCAGVCLVLYIPMAILGTCLANWRP